MSDEISLEEYKEAWREMEIREAKKGLYEHVISYIIVNAFLIFINLWTNPEYIWFIWILVGWGIGLAFHLAFSRPKIVIENLRKKEAMAELLAREKKRGRFQ